MSSFEIGPAPGGSAIHQKIDPRTVGRWLAVMVFAITSVSVLTHVLRFTILDGRQHAVLMVFDTNSEHSFATYYQGISLLIASLLLVMAARLPRRAAEPKGRWWGVLAGMFAMLSFDELCELHENVGYAFEKAVHPHGYFHFGWVIPAIGFVCIFGGIYLRFLFQLPLRTRLRFIVAGAIYVGSAVGVEMLSGKYADALGEENVTYQLLSDLEECGEMTGVGIFIFALASHLQQKRAQLSIDFAHPSDTRCETRVEDPSGRLRKVA